MIRLAALALISVSLLSAKITVGTAAPVVAAGTEILVNLDTFLHPKKSVKAAGRKIKAAFKPVPVAPPNPVAVPPQEKK